MATFVIDLKDQVSAPAKKGAKALTDAEKAAKTLRDAMGGLAAQMVKAKALGDVQKFWKLRDQMDKYGKALAKLPPEHKKEEKSFEGFEKGVTMAHNAIVQAVAGITAVLGAMKSGDAAGVVEGLTHGFAGLAKTLNLVVPGLGEAAATIIEVYGAIAGATVGLIQEGAKLALEQTEVRNKLLATFEAMGGAPGAGKKVLGMLDDLSDQLGVTRDSLVETTKQFQAMGITDLGELRNQVKATAAITSALGETGAAAYQKIIAKTHEAITTGGKFKVSDKQIAGFREMGLNIDEIATQMGTTSKALRAGLTNGTQNAQKFQDALTAVAKNKFGDTLKDQALSWTNVVAKGKELIGRLFDGIDVKPFTEAVSQFFSIFSQGKSSGKAMKSGLTASFNELFKILGKVVFKAEGFFLKMEIWVLKAYIAMKPWIKKWDELNKKFGVVSKLVYGLKILFVTLAVIVAGAMAAVIAPIALFVAGIVAAITEVSLLIGAIKEGFPKAVAAVKAFFLSLATTVLDNIAKWIFGAGDLASKFIDGLVGGIKAGISKVIDAAKSVGSAALKGVKDVLGIHSPSRVMLQMGVQTGAGFGAGLHRSRGMVLSAGAGMGAGAAVGVGRGMSAAPMTTNNSSSKHVTVHVGGIHIGGGGGKGASELTEEAVTLIFERIALQEGL